MTKAYRTNAAVLFLLFYMMMVSFFWYPLTMYLPISYAGEMILNQVLCFIVPFFFYLWVTKEDWRSILKLNRLGFKNAVLIILIVIFLEPFTSFLSVLTSMFFPNAASELMTETVEISLPMMLLSIAVTPAICEEIFFRGVVLSGYDKMSAPKAIVMGGLMFGIMHMNAQQFLYTFFLGTVFCYFVYETKSIFASMLPHFFVNASQLILSRISMNSLEATQEVYRETVTFMDMFGVLFTMGILTLFSLPFLALLFYGFYRNNHPKKGAEGSISLWKKWGTLSFWFGGERAMNIPFFLILCYYGGIVLLLPFVNFLLERLSTLSI